MVDVKKEKLIPLYKVPKFDWMPRHDDGTPYAAQAVHNWAVRGIRGVRLEILNVGGIRHTTEEAVLRFFEKITVPIQRPQSVTPAEARRAHQSAKERLAAMGV